MATRAPGSARPRVLLNCAISTDGHLAFAGGRPAALSGPNDRKRVQELRAGCGAILVGVGTVLADDPSLRVHWEELGRAAGREPLRVIVDSRARVPDTARVLDGSRPTLIATATGVRRAFPPGVEHFAAGNSRVDLAALFRELRTRGIEQLLVEGGGEVIASVLRGGWWDRMTVYVAPLVIGGATAPPMARGPETPSFAEAVALRLVSVAGLDDGALLTYEPRGPA